MTSPVTDWLLAILISCGGIALLTAFVALRRWNIARGLSHAARAAAIDDYRRHRDKADLGLLCPVCGALAEPMCGTHDRYCCVQCGHRFVEALHRWTL